MNVAILATKENSPLEVINLYKREFERDIKKAVFGRD